MKTTKNYFVMLNVGDSGNVTPLTDANVHAEMAFFESIGDAKTAAESSSLGFHCGYTVHEKYVGVDEE